jgi:DNA-binding protein H-NS
MPTYEELLAQRAELDRQISAARQAELAEAIETIKSLVRKYDLSAEDCGFKSQKGSAKAKQAAPVKYRGPNGETWAGRGRTPAWLAALESSGASREQYRAE